VIAVGKHSRRDPITAAVDGHHAGRQVAELDRLLDRAEGAAIAESIRKTKQATDIAWPPPSATE
jgi:hypothetical protein